MVKIFLDKERELKLDLNALCRFEEVTGKNALESLKGLNASDMRALLWACLDDSELTLEDVGKLITADNIEQISKSLAEAVANPTLAQSG